MGGALRQYGRVLGHQRPRRGAGEAGSPQNRLRAGGGAPVRPGDGVQRHRKRVRLRLPRGVRRRDPASRGGDRSPPLCPPRKGNENLISLSFVENIDIWRKTS